MREHLCSDIRQLDYSSPGRGQINSGTTLLCHWKFPNKYFPVHLFRKIIKRGPINIETVLDRFQKREKSMPPMCLPALKESIVAAPIPTIRCCSTILLIRDPQVHLVINRFLLQPLTRVLRTLLRIIKQLNFKYSYPCG